MTRLIRGGQNILQILLHSLGRASNSARQDGLTKSSLRTQSRIGSQA